MRRYVCAILGCSTITVETDARGSVDAGFFLGDCVILQFLPVFENGARSDGFTTAYFDGAFSAADADLV